MDLQSDRSWEYLIERKDGQILDIVVPVYNEDKGILRLFEEIEQEIKTPKSVMVVYDVDGDTTVPVVKEHQNDYYFIIVLVLNTIWRGALNAIKMGMQTATEEMVLVMMADSYNKLDAVDSMCGLMEQGYDLVCGSRYMRGGCPKTLWLCFDDHQSGMTR